MKDIHLAISYSQDRIREVVKELAREDWILFLPDPADGRSKLVKPTERALRLLEEYQAHVMNGIAVKAANETAEVTA